MGEIHGVRMYFLIPQQTGQQFQYQVKWYIW